MALCSAAASAATDSAAFVISVEVSPTCTLAAGALRFGTYSGSEDLASATLTLVCTSTTLYNIGLSAGAGAGATVGNRVMTGPGAETVRYGLYQDAMRTMQWGDTVGTDTVAATGSGATQQLTVYGRIEAGQFRAPGSYTDAIVATVTY